MQSTKMGRTPRCNKMGLNRGPWSREEDDLLTKYIQSFGEGGWRTLPKKAGLQRCGKSCRLRWMNYLRPDVKRGYISPAEEDLILRLHRLLGNRWSLIAGRIPGRTDNEIKNYWNTHLRKQLIRQGIDPQTHKPLPELPLLQGSCSPEDSDHPSQRSSMQETRDCSQSEFQTSRRCRSNSLKLLQEDAMVSTNNLHVLTDPKLMDNENKFLRDPATTSPHIANSVLNFCETDTNWKSLCTSMNYETKASAFDTSFIFPDQPQSMLPFVPLNVDMAVRCGNQQMMSCTSLDYLPKYMEPLQSAGSESHNSYASHWNMTASTSMTSVWSLDMSSPVTKCGSQHTSVLGELYDFTSPGQNSSPALPRIEFGSDPNILASNPTLAANLSCHQSFVLGDTNNYMFPTSSHLSPITPIPMNKAGNEDPADSDTVFSSTLQSFVHAEASLMDYHTPSVQNKQTLYCLNPHEDASHSYNNDM